MIRPGHDSNTTETGNGLVAGNGTSTKAAKKTTTMASCAIGKNAKRSKKVVKKYTDVDQWT